MATFKGSKTTGSNGFRVKVALNNGQRFETLKGWFADNTVAYNYWNYSYQDMNGDGLVDFVATFKGSKTTGSNGFRVNIALNKAQKPSITHITNNTDQDIHITYKNMTDKSSDVYATTAARNTKPWNSISKGNIPVRIPMNLVYSVKSTNGIGGLNEVQYKYHDFIVNKLHGGQGFRYIITYNMTTQMASGTLYKQIGAKNGDNDTDGHQFTGMPYYTYTGRAFTGTGASKKLDTWGKFLSRTSITYKDASTRAKIHEPYTYSNIKTLYDPSSKEAISSIYHYNTISTNGLGNIVKTVDRTYDYVNKKNFYKTVINEYKAEDRSAWIIGRLTKATVTHTQTDGGTVVRSSTFKYNSKGLLSEEVANAGTKLALKKSYAYDSHGNKIKETISGAGIATATTTFGYSSEGKFQTKVTNAAGLSEYRTFDARFGSIKTLKGPNGLTTTWTYDGMGRKIEERRADGTKTSWEYAWGKNYIDAKYVLYTVGVSNSGKPSVRNYYDVLGRDVGSYTYTMKKGNRQDYTSRRIVKRKYYNAKGELVKEELPHYQGEGAGAIYTSYDKYGRPIKVTKPGPDGTTQSYATSYKNFTTIVTDPKGNKKQTVKNAIGQTIKITDAYGTGLASSITYKYDAAGNLIGTTDAAGNVVTMQYDAAGNKTYMNDPDLGIWHYEYNAAGKLAHQWSGTAGFDRSEHATYKTYDILGRVIRDMNYNHIEYNTDKQTFSYNQTDYVYGGAGASAGSRGKLLKVTASSRMRGEPAHIQTVTQHYDKLGRVVSSTTKISSRGDYLTSTTYDAYSRPSTITYPNGYKITNHYNEGILDYVKGSDGKVHYQVNDLNAFGQVDDATFANGVHTVYGYDAAGYLLSLSSQSQGHFNDVQQLHYVYDLLGNVTQRIDSSIAGKTIDDRFGYDAMDRLTSMHTTSDVRGAYAKSKAYRYDKLGNMVYQSGIGNYSYYADKPHAVKSAGNRSYTYDEVGNMTHRNGDTITYNPISKPAILKNHKNGKEVHFYYGVGGARFMKSTDKHDIYYIGKAYEEQVAGSEEKQICYITIGGKTIGTHTEVINTDYVPTNPNYKETPYNRYFHTDALGSITAITDDTGKVVERRSYDAFGKIRAMDYGTNNNTLADITTQTSRAFTGHEQIAELPGLIHMNARLYDSEIGRFLSADTIIQAPYDSQSYNRYSYVRNNPLKYTDPTGHSWLSKVWKKVKHWVKKHARAIGAIVAAAVVAIVAPPLLASGLGIAAGSTASAVATGALAGAASGAIQTKSLKGALKGAFFGAVGAAAAVGVANVTAKVFDISRKAAHSLNFWKAGINKASVFKATLHGLTRGAIQAAQGGKFKAGFLSGFSSAFDVGTKGHGGFVGRTVIMAVVGGTASALGGGKFSNGAMSGAFVHMFNHEFGEALKTKQLMEKSGKKDIFIAHGKGSKGYYVKDSRGFMYPSDTPEMRQHLESLKVGMMIPAGIAATAGGTTLMMTYPLETMAGIGIADNLFMGGTPPNTWKEFGAMILHDYNPWAAK